LRYDEIVLEGATPRTLAFGPARLMSGAAMGEAGNLVLAGHRTSWFRPLEGMQRGDEIELGWFDARGELHERTYTVNMINITEPQETSLLAPTSEDALTLITCYPFGRRPGSPLRFVVTALPVRTNGEGSVQWSYRQSGFLPLVGMTRWVGRGLSELRGPFDSPRSGQSLKGRSSTVLRAGNRAAFAEARIVVHLCPAF
jgi:sortase A